MHDERRHARRGARGIGVSLALVVLVTLLPAIALEIYRGVQDVERRHQAIALRARTEATEEADTMDDFLRFAERFLATLASSPQVQTLDAVESEKLFHAARRQNVNFVNVFLLDPDGRQIASTEPDVEDPSVTERPYFRDALHSTALAISEVLVWPGAGRSVVVLAHPVVREDGARIAVLAVALNIARLGDVIGYVGLPPGSVVILAQRNGAVIAASDDPEQWVGQRIADHAALDAGDHATISAALEEIDGVARVAGVDSLGRAPWRVIAAIPQAEIQAEQRRSLLRITQQAAIAAVVTVALAFAVLRRVITPIRLLSDGARDFAAGRLHRRIPVRRRDELGDLAQALNSMAAELERRLAEEAARAQSLQELNQLQTEFVATASHELRTPVAAIRAYVEALLRPDIIDDAVREECISGIDRSSERLVHLARTLLDVSRIDAGRVAVHLTAVDAVTVAASAVAQVRAHRPGVEVSVIAEPCVPPALADADRLEDALANLIDNACKFAFEGEPVTIRVSGGGGRVAIAVEDRGPGIPARDLPHIFDRFYQAERGTERGRGGSGLGLYIARGYVRAMSGRISVESRAGQGSVFTVELTATPDAARPSDGETPGEIHAVTTSHPGRR